MSFASILRLHQYEELKEISLNGSVLDIGGSRKSGYHELIKGAHIFTVVNYGDLHPGADLVFDAELRFPLENNSYDNVLMLNVIEHIFDTHNVFSEVSRVLKPGGLFVAATPFMHHIHGSPNDYVRYTESAYRKFAERYGFEVLEMKTLGFGFFSLIFQTFTSRNLLRYAFLHSLLRNICKWLDQILLHFSIYRKFAKTIPLAYLWIMKKK